MSFFSTTEKAFGLDISDQTLRLIQLARTGKNFKIALYNEIKLPEGCLKKGKIIQPKIFSDHLKKLTETTSGHGSLSNKAVISLPETETFIKNFQLEATNEVEAKQQLTELLPQSIPWNIEDIYWDYEIIKKNNSIIGAVAGASPKDIIDDYLKVFTTAKIEPAVLEIESSAIYNLLIEHNNNHLPQIIVDIGKNRTGLFLYDGEIIQFAISLPLSGDNITDIIAEAIDLTKEQAEKAKLICGLDTQKSQGAVAEILKPQLKNLSQNIIDAINFYYANFPQAKEIKNIYLCGGGANLKNIEKIIKELSGIETLISEPFKKIKNNYPKFFTKEKSQSFITAIGLALRGINPNSFYDHS